MILALDRPLVCIDLETTGLDVDKDRIVEIGLVKLGLDGKRQSVQRRVDPGIEIPEASTRIHGIRNEDVRGLFGEPALGKLGQELCAFIGDADLCGFNITSYDLPLWLAECRRHRLEFPMAGRRVVDARTIFVTKEKSWDRFILGPRNLNNAVLHYCGRARAASFAQRDEVGEGLAKSVDQQKRHSAVKDAEATLDVLLAQLVRYAELPRTVAGLDEFCRSAALEAKQAAAG
jgi:DNA polymerase-3 subunit epsilon